MDPLDDFSKINKTELYQLCVRAGLRVSIGSSREQLIDALVHQDPVAGNVGVHLPIVESTREFIYYTLREHWTELQPQLKCPARNFVHPDPSVQNKQPCSGCIALQVLSCGGNIQRANPGLLDKYNGL